MKLCRLMTTSTWYKIYFMNHDFFFVTKSYFSFCILIISFNKLLHNNKLLVRLLMSVMIKLWWSYNFYAYTNQENVFHKFFMSLNVFWFFYSSQLLIYYVWSKLYGWDHLHDIKSRLLRYISLMAINIY